MELPGTLWLVLFLLISVLTYEIILPTQFYEGFKTMVNVIDESEKNNY